MNNIVPAFLGSLLRNLFPNDSNLAPRDRDLGQAVFGHRHLSEPSLLSQPWFNRLLALEVRRTERSKTGFVLMTLSMSGDPDAILQVSESVVRVITPFTRETDVIGWYELGSSIGVIFTGVDANGGSAAAGASIKSKIDAALHAGLGSEPARRIITTIRVFPETGGSKGDKDPIVPEQYLDFPRSRRSEWLESPGKRGLDLLGSAMALIVLAIPMLLIAAIVKATSKGPVFFKQERVGRHGKRFTFLKFRSMYQNNDSQLHKDYVSKFIAGTAECSGGKVYKLTADPRITPVGRFLRKSSLDELPQFWNVFRGDMSLVGPRPPVPYEMDAYDLWHRRRVLDAKPGITGLWQVTGRSRTKFEDMVRLDLKYTRTSSFALDLEILWRTPRAVVTGDGAY